MKASERTDAELLQQHLAGDPDAFEALASRYTDELFGFLLRYVNQPAIADDLVQETFVQVHLSADSFDPSRRFKPWLYTIAANKARDYLRAKSRRPLQSLDAVKADDDAPALADQLESDAPTADQQLADAERRQRVRDLIEQMPEHLRTILLLGHFQKLPYAEIGEVLDIPVGTVKSRLHAAVNHFAKLWETRGEPREHEVER